MDQREKRSHDWLCRVAVSLSLSVCKIAHQLPLQSESIHTAYLLFLNAINIDAVIWNAFGSFKLRRSTIRIQINRKGNGFFSRRYIISGIAINQLQHFCLFIYSFKCIRFTFLIRRTLRMFDDAKRLVEWWMNPKLYIPIHINFRKRPCTGRDMWRCQLDVSAQRQRYFFVKLL